MPDQQRVHSQCRRIFDTAAGKLRHLVTAHPDFFPMYTRAGKWRHDGELWTNWCEGFLPGQLWLMYLYSGDAFWRAQAERYSQLLEARKSDRDTHDLGFLFWHTWKRWHDITGDERCKQVVIAAGRTMGLRYQAAGAYLSSFVAPESCFIDIMMNVGIIFYAGRESGEDDLFEIARQHCLTSRRYLARGDGSVAHEGIFDLDSGAFLRESTHQGWRHDSSWARGLAWAMYGFATAFAFTRDTRFLGTACACADYYMRHTPDHGICPNDWLEPQPERQYESSAAAITSCALQVLAGLVTDSLHRQVYLDYAGRIIDRLSQPDFLASDDSDWEGVMKGASYHERLGLGVDESAMFGDYFLLEAAARLLGLI